MKKAEKTQMTIQRIMDAAMREFGAHGYDGASINDICKNHDISKGLIYHNFSGKDELYLLCVGRVFDEFAAHLKSHAMDGSTRAYMDLRYQFFSARPLASRIFFEAVLQPPAALAAQIRARKAALDKINLEIYRAVLRGLTLRPGVDERDAIAYFSMTQEMFNGYFSSPAYTGAAFDDVVQNHEAWLGKMLEFMLYGIAKGENV